MKIEFEDNSFVEIMESGKENELIIAMCGYKDYRNVTVSSSSLSAQQIDKIIDYLVDWRKNINDDD